MQWFEDESKIRFLNRDRKFGILIDIAWKWEKLSFRSPTFKFGWKKHEFSRGQFKSSTYLD